MLSLGQPAAVFGTIAELSERNSDAKPGQASEKVGEIGNDDPHSCPGKADGAHEQRHAVLLRGNDMPDAGADPGT